MAKTTETVQLDKETVIRIYNKEEGYEPAKVAPCFVESLRVLLLCILLAGWTISDGRSKYNVDVSEIIAERVQLLNGQQIAYVDQGASKEEAEHHVLLTHDFLLSRLLGLSGVNENPLNKYSVHLVSYNQPRIDQSNLDVNRTLNSSTEDMAAIANALGMRKKGFFRTLLVLLMHGLLCTSFLIDWLAVG